MKCAFTISMIAAPGHLAARDFVYAALHKQRFGIKWR